MPARGRRAAGDCNGPGDCNAPRQELRQFLITLVLEKVLPIWVMRHSLFFNPCLFTKSWDLSARSWLKVVSPTCCECLSIWSGLY
jgi:hypothetical protein